MTAPLKIRVLEQPVEVGVRFVAEYLTGKIGVVGFGATETAAKGDLAAQAAWYAPDDPEYLAVVADDPDVLRAAVAAAKRNATKRRIGADVHPEREDLLRSAKQWDRAAACLQTLLDKVTP